MTETLSPLTRHRLQEPVRVFISRPAGGYSRLAITLSLASVAALQGTPVLAQGAFAGAAGAGIGSPAAIAQFSPAPVTTTPVPHTTGTTILPTDVLPLPQIQNRMTFGENLQLRVLQKLPARFYFSSSTETTFRLETNVFQYPPLRILERKIGLTAQTFAEENAQQKYTTVQTLRKASAFDVVYRILPNVTAGYTLTPRTRVYGTFFMIRDSLIQHVQLNTMIYSYGYGVQRDIPIGNRANLQADLQFRELNQMHQHSVFDFLPGLTLSMVATPRTVAYVNALMQIRGRKYFQAPTRELDPFYTWGLLHQRGRWSFSASSTFVQNFRQPFGHHATIPVNNYAMISDFEIDRRIFAQIPGLQAFVRAEPIWDMHAHNRPGLAGMDFRCYFGLRFSMSKPALTMALDSLRRQLEEQEVTPPVPQQQNNAPVKPSAFLTPEHLPARQAQPMHGFLPVAVALNSGTGVLTDSLLTLHSPKLQLPGADGSVFAAAADNWRAPLMAPAARQIAEQEESPLQLVSDSAAQPQ